MPDEDIDKDMEVTPPTTFQEMYEFFLAAITDDMFIDKTYIVVKKGKKNYFIGKC